MFDIFGKMDSVEELNMCAEGLREEGDVENLKKLAEENGIMDGLVEAYIAGAVDELCDVENAAMGRLEIEGNAYEDKRYPIKPVVNFLKALCYEEDGAAERIMRKEKSMKDCMASIKEKCEEHKNNTGDYFVEDMVLFNWAKEYYIG